MRVAGVGLWSRYGVSVSAVFISVTGAPRFVGRSPVRSWTFVMSAVGGGWSSGADFSKDAIGDLDRVCEYRCLGSGVHIVSHSGSSTPRIILSQQKLRMGRSRIGFFVRYRSMAVRDSSRVF